MAGRLGNKKVTVQNLKVLKVDTDKNILLVKGAVPGHKGSIISIFDSVKKKQDIKTSTNENPKSVEEQKNIQETQNVENKITHLNPIKMKLKIKMLTNHWNLVWAKQKKSRRMTITKINLLPMKTRTMIDYEAGSKKS